MVRTPTRFLITGGAGFMGSDFVRLILSLDQTEKVVVYDALTYAGSLENLSEFLLHPAFEFVQGNILDQDGFFQLLKHQPIDAIVHFAAETHVDRSIEDPFCFAKTNVLGTLTLLEVLRHFPHIHFHHISTDEVYGSLQDKGTFDENSPYQPNSPYSASKAASDHFVRAYGHTYQLKVTTSHASNNYGPRQYPEKLIPKLISHLMQEKPFPLYGHGKNVREWTFVEDHSLAVLHILKYGQFQEVYNIGSGVEMTNIQVIEEVIDTLALQTGNAKEQFQSYVVFVEDRKGHDFRYALNPQKMLQDLDWKPRTDFKTGLKKTIEYYLLQDFSMERS